MARRAQTSLSLADSQRHGLGCELFLVEGESAAGAVASVRDARTQAVLPLQGKPLNAWRATPVRVAAFPLYQQLAAALGLPSPIDAGHVDASSLHFERLALLFDPDADGIHIGALLLLYLQRFAPALLAQERVWMVRAPMAGLRLAARDTGETEDVWAIRPSKPVRCANAPPHKLSAGWCCANGAFAAWPVCRRMCCAAPAWTRARAMPRW